MRIVSLGMVTSQGLGVDAFEKALRSGSFSRDLGHTSSRWAARRYGVRLVEDLEGLTREHLSTADIRRVDRVGILGLLAAQQALARAGIEPPLGGRTGLVVASTHGAIGFSVDYHSGAVLQGAKGLSALLFSASLLSSATGSIALVLGARGPTHTLTAGATAAADVLELASLLLETEEVDRILAVGADMFHPIYLDAYDATFRMHARFGRTPDPIKVFHHAEGAVALLLERGDGPGPGRVTGASGTHLGRGWRDPLAAKMRLAWETAGISPRDADLFLPGSNHTFLDALEREALADFALLPRERIFALKPKTGEGFAYTSMLQVAAGLLLLEPGGTALVQGIHFDGAVGAVAVERSAP